MFDKLSEIEKRYQELETKLVDPDIATDHKKYAKFAKERAEIEAVVETWREYERTRDELEQAQQVLEEESDADLLEMAREEERELEQHLEELDDKLKLLLIPKDEMDERNVVVEVRAGTGGDEAGLFAGDIYRMYLRYAEKHRWSVELLSSSEAASGGYKEVIFLVEGEGAYSRLKYESGVHRVQRVPETESQGRIHTSAVTVAVLPEAEEVDIDIHENDIRVDVYRSSGPGGQSVNTTDSAVRITHIETGLVVTCQDEKSQHKNKAKALKVLRSRLLELEEQKRADEISAARRTMVGSGDRSEKIRTYNFPQSRVTDHRIKYTTHRLGEFLDGEIDDLVEELTAYMQAELLKVGQGG